jgi:hypothetical protein
MSDSDTTPIACSLAPGRLADRVEWIARLNARALRDHRRDGSTLYLTYDRLAAADVRELVRRERSCCGFLRFDIDEAADAIRLAIAAPPEARGAADALFACFVA